MPYPLHPAVVHFPVVLATLLPLGALAVLVAIRMTRAPARVAWAPVAILAALMTLSAWVALETGEDQEEAVEAVVPRDAIHQHEEAAEAFLAASAVTLLLVLAGLAPGRAGRAGRVAGTLAALVMVGMAWRVGRSGGELVYVHDAARAYATGEGSPAGAGGDPGGRDTDHTRSGDDEHR